MTRQQSPPGVTIEMSGGYGFDRLERTLKTLQPLLHLREPAVVTVDLTRLVHLGPTSLALVIAALQRAVEFDLLLESSVIHPPASPPVRQYLERMNLVREVIGDDIPEGFNRNAPVGFRPVQHIAPEGKSWIVAKSLSDALTERCVADEVAHAAVYVCLDEVCENVVHHADTPLGGFAAAQGWPRSNRQFEIGIVDLGVGVRGSLTKNEQYAHITDDVTAITTALQPRVTATPERNAGIGLAVTSMLLAANGGSMIVRSGRGAVMSGVASVAEIRDADLPGTVVSLRANMDRPLDINAVYEHLPEVEAQDEDLQEHADDADYHAHEHQAQR